MKKLPLCSIFFLALAVSSAVVTAAESKKVVFGYSTIGAMAAGAWMAKEIGAYEKYGIDAELIYISSGPTVVQALLGGDVTGGIAATNAVIAAVLRGAPLVSVVSTANRPYHRLWVQPEIMRVEDLKGKAIGVTRFGSVTDNLTRMILKKYGLESTVNVRQMGGTAEVSAAFQKADCRCGHLEPACGPVGTATASHEVGGSRLSIFDGCHCLFARRYKACSATGRWNGARLHRRRRGDSLSKGEGL